MEQNNIDNPQDNQKVPSAPKKGAVMEMPTGHDILERKRRDTEVRWYALYVNSQHERKVAAAIDRNGIETYVPIRRELHQWSDRKKWVDIVLTPHLIFVHLAMVDKKLVYVSDRVNGFVHAPGEGYKPCPIGDAQMRDFIEMTQKMSNIEIIKTPLQRGDRVRVIHGPMEGYIGECMNIQGTNYILVRLNEAMTATARIPLEWVEKMPK